MVRSLAALFHVVCSPRPSEGINEEGDGMGIQFTTAARSSAKLRLGLAGPAGSGKTYSALLLGLALASHPSKVFVLDSERRSASLYAHLGTYQVGALEPPYSPKNYVDAINAAEDAGAEVIIIDSLSHAWAGEGGALEIVDAKAAASTSRNSYTAWREVTPMHNRLVDAMLQSPAHMIVTLRTKSEYVTERDERTGKMVPRKIGLAPIQREGLDYEFTVFADVSLDHRCMVTKDRTEIFTDGVPFIIDANTGKKLLTWLNVAGSKPAAAPVKVSPPPEVKQPETQPSDWDFLVSVAHSDPAMKKRIDDYCAKKYNAAPDALNDSQLADVVAKVRSMTQPKPEVKVEEPPPVDPGSLPPPDPDFDSLGIPDVNKPVTPPTTITKPILAMSQAELWTWFDANLTGPTSEARQLALEARCMEKYNMDYAHVSEDLVLLRETAVWFKNTVIEPPLTPPTQKRQSKKAGA